MSPRMLAVRISQDICWSPLPCRGASFPCDPRCHHHPRYGWSHHGCSSRNHPRGGRAPRRLGVGRGRHRQFLYDDAAIATAATAVARAIVGPFRA